MACRVAVVHGGDDPIQVHLHRGVWLQPLRRLLLLLQPLLLLVVVRLQVQARTSLAFRVHR